MSRFQALGTALAAACLLAAPAPMSAQVGPNDVALGKAAYQVSDYDVWHTAANAVDGNTNGNHYANSTTHTAGGTPEYEGWWYVDLGGNFDISSITLWNRTDCCGDRLSNFYLSILAGGTSNISSSSAPVVWRQYISSVGTFGVYTPPAGTVGQYVKVQYDQHGNWLQLAEVDVEGTAVSAVPEPSSLALVATGLVAVFARRRRRA